MEEEIIVIEDNDIEEINIEEENYSGKPYELPIASKNVLGGIKVGENLTIDADGTLNAQASSNGEGITSEEKEMIYVNLSTAYEETINAWQKKSIPLDTEISKLGANLTLTNEGRIKIGSGISKISIQAGILASPQTKEGILDCRIYLVRDGKQILINQTYTELVTLKYSVTTFNTVPIYDVQENDEIELVYTSNVAGTFKIFQTGTFLSVEKINVNNLVAPNEPSELIVIGDSWSDLAVTDAIWSNIVSKELGLTLHNYAVNGAGFVKPTTKLMNTQIDTFINSSIDKTRVKYIILMGGINDYKLGVSMSDLANAIISCYQSLKSVCPKAKIIYINNCEYPYTLAQSIYWTRLFKKLAKTCNIELYNTDVSYNMELFNSSNYFHLTQDGQKFLAKNIISFLNGMPTTRIADVRTFENDDFKISLITEKISENRACLTFYFKVKTVGTSYRYNLTDSDATIPYYDANNFTGEFGSNFNNIVVDIGIGRYTLVASSSELKTNVNYYQIFNDIILYDWDE